ncbi:hypothetical protein FAIPA1_130140 [Frankia sp. AiPs1]|uniref:sigma factor n=1 Tax=Frankia sp. AiPa1 TaxID=573492 RepID=UPI00202B5D65|nr:sigma factor [Frankia sp. AiPa1]MCL9761546.1 hypothetical protein [Frankia sp. AiPa1]
MSGWDDAVSDGLLALWQAIRSHDPAKGPLSTHVELRIRWALVDGLRRRGGLRGAGRHPDDVPLDDADTVGAMAAPADEDQIAVWELVRQAEAIDPRLARIVLLRAAEYSYTEIGYEIHLSRTRVAQFLNLLRAQATS